MVACQPTPPTDLLPTDIPFPTMTLGHRLTGQLAPPPLQLDDTDGLSNPATVAAQTNRPTPTPNTNACPPNNPQALLDELPTDVNLATDAIARFLSSGGSIDDLEEQLADDWDVLDNGYVRNDVDMTGEGQPEVVVGYVAPGELGTLAIFGCVDGQMITRFQAISNQINPPQILWLSDMNNDFRGELMFTVQNCADPDACVFSTQVISWDRELGRFVNLIEGTINSFSVPTLNDIDEDEVAEIVVSLDSRGTSATGPLRTGVHIYDWNGEIYVLSIIQLDSPRYRIQIVHQADKEFNRLNMEDAAALSTNALENEDLRYWFNDGPTNLNSYIIYRLLLTYAFLNDERINDVALLLNTDYPITADTNPANLPVYVEMSYAFISGWQADSDLGDGCTLAQGVIEQRPEALELLNRYGENSPIYNAIELCPF